MNPFESYFCQHLFLHVDVLDAIYPTGWDYNLLQCLSCTDAADRTVKPAELAAMINCWLSTLCLFEPKAFYRYKTTNQVLKTLHSINQLFVKIDTFQQGKIAHLAITFVCFSYFGQLSTPLACSVSDWPQKRNPSIFFFALASLLCYSVIICL